MALLDAMACAKGDRRNADRRHPRSRGRWRRSGGSRRRAITRRWRNDYWLCSTITPAPYRSETPAARAFRSELYRRTDDGRDRRRLRTLTGMPAKRTLRICLRAAEAACVHHAQVDRARSRDLNRSCEDEEMSFKDAVMSRAIFQPGLVYRVSCQQRPTRMTSVSSGTTSFRRDHARPDAKVERVPPYHPPAENRFSRLCRRCPSRDREEILANSRALPPGAPIRRGEVERHRPCEKLSSALSTSAAVSS